MFNSSRYMDRNNLRLMVVETSPMGPFSHPQQSLRSSLCSHRAADLGCTQPELKGCPCPRPVPPQREGSWHLQMVPTRRHWSQRSRMTMFPPQQHQPLRRPATRVPPRRTQLRPVSSPTGCGGPGVSTTADSTTRGHPPVLLTSACGPSTRKRELRQQLRR